MVCDESCTQRDALFRCILTISHPGSRNVDGWSLSCRHTRGGLYYRDDQTFC
jgi:hypothetical protein